MESNVEGKEPRLKRGGEHREENTIGHRVQLGTATMLFFLSTGCAFHPASRYEYGNARGGGGGGVQPARLCCIHLFRQVQSYARGFVVITLSDTWLHSLRCARVERPHHRLSTHDITLLQRTRRDGTIISLDLFLRFADIR